MNSAYEYPLAGAQDPLSRAQVLEEIPSTVPLVRNHVRLHQVPGVHLTESTYPALSICISVPPITSFSRALCVSIVATFRATIEAAI
jgi:hypothetical protein